MDVAVRLLGPVELLVDGGPVHPGGGRPRAVLAVLAAAGGAPVPAGRLAEAVWSDTGTPAGRGTLQVHVHAVRRALGRHAALVEHTAAGYRLHGAAVDLREAEDRISRARAADRAGDAAGAAEGYRAALELWRGPLCADLPDHRALDAARTLYAGMRLEALECRIGADLRAGAGGLGLVAELDDLVSAHPLRERLWGQLMVALYREGRQADALDRYHRARAVLVEEAGLDPGTALRELERAILDRAGTTALLRVAAPDGAMPGRTQLTWVDAAGTPRRRAVLDGDELVIGRGAGVAVRLAADAAVSREHAVVTGRAGQVHVRDLGSRNGTTCNGEPLPPDGTRLRPGDLLRCGDSVLAIAGRPGSGPAEGTTRPPQ